MTFTIPNQSDLDRELSNRFIALDPGGYFIISIDRDARLIRAEHYTNTITDRGLAADPETGEVIACSGGVKRAARQLYEGRSAKEICIKLFEENDDCPVTMFDHAAYLGREFVRAEIALLDGSEYVQD